MSELLKELLLRGEVPIIAGSDGTDEGGAGGTDDKGGAGGTDDKSGGAGGTDDKSGKGGMSDKEAELLKEVMQKKDALKKAQELNDSLASKLKDFEGIDASAVRKLLADKEEAEKKQLEAKGDWERLKIRMAEEHGTEVTKLRSSIEELQSQLGKANSVINDLSIGNKFGQSTFISEKTTLTPSKARVIYGDHFDLVEGEIVAYDKPRNATNRTPIVNQYGSPVAFDEALKKIVEADPEKDHVLKSKVRTGADSGTGKGGKGDQSGRSGDQSQSDQKPRDGVSKIAAGLSSLSIGIKK